MKKILGILAATSFISACANYPTQKAGSPQALLNIDGDADLTAATRWLLYDNACFNINDKSGLLALTGNITGRKKQVAMAADVPVFLIAVTLSSSRSMTPGQMNINSCNVKIKFTPEDGKTYGAKLLPDQCHVSLVDHQTMRTPANTEFVTNDNWKKYTADCPAK